MMRRRWLYICFSLVLIANLAIAAWNVRMLFHSEKLDAGYLGLRDVVFVSGYALKEYEREHKGRRPAALSQLQHYMKQHKFTNGIVEVNKQQAASVGFQYDPQASEDEPILAYYQTFPTRRIFWLDARSRVYVGTPGYLSIRQIRRPGIAVR